MYRETPLYVFKNKNPRSNVSTFIRGVFYLEYKLNVLNENLLVRSQNFQI